MTSIVISTVPQFTSSLSSLALSAMEINHFVAQSIDHFRRWDDQRYDLPSLLYRGVLFRDSDKGRKLVSQKFDARVARSLSLRSLEHILSSMVTVYTDQNSLPFQKDLAQIIIKSVWLAVDEKTTKPPK